MLEILCLRNVYNAEQKQGVHRRAILVETGDDYFMFCIACVFVENEIGLFSVCNAQVSILLHVTLI